MYSFIAFDVVDFYPSISIELLSEALQFTSEYDTIRELKQTTTATTTGTSPNKRFDEENNSCARAL